MANFDPQPYHQLFDFLAKKKTGSKATKKWLNAASTQLAALDRERLVRFFLPAFENAIDGLTTIYKSPAHSYYERRPKLAQEELFIGLAWATGLLNHPRLNVELEALARWALKKKRGSGQLATRLANAALYAFSLLPAEQSVAILNKFRLTIKYASSLKQIDKYLHQIATQENKTLAELAEWNVPTFDLSENYDCQVAVGTYLAHLKIEDFNKVSLQWISPENNFRKTLPASVARAFPEALKIAKQKQKALKKQLSIERRRIEQFYLQKRRWTIADWSACYLEHPLVSFVTKRLIWQFSNEIETVSGSYYQGKWYRSNGKVLSLKKMTEVELWHPIQIPVAIVMEWRQFLEKRQLRQAFKQAFREIYLLTAAEQNTNSYSNRFAAHILKQNQFAALCSHRGWRHKSQGQWENSGVTSVEVPSWNIRAEFWLEVDWEGPVTPGGTFNYIFTDQVRFYQDEDQLMMEEVPAIVFSEVMRDVDLFVGVSSIGNDPNWQDGLGNRYTDYWQEYSFSELSESAKMRKQVLENLVPRLKIAKQCSFNNRYLIVKGKIRTYKIHLGSGNILMEPNDQYLCIVLDRGQEDLDKKVYLPFEGDSLLSIILSKAFLLAADEEITDTTITSQLTS